MKCFSHVFCILRYLESPKGAKKRPRTVGNFAREIDTGTGETFTKYMKMFIGNGHGSLIASGVGPIESGIDLIIPSGWWLKDHRLTYPNNSTN